MLSFDKETRKWHNNFTASFFAGTVLLFTYLDACRVDLYELVAWKEPDPNCAAVPDHLHQHTQAMLCTVWP